MSEPILCSQCGNEIPAGSPAGLCPKCLLQAGMESRSAAAAKVEPTQPSPPAGSAGFAPPAAEALADRFPQLEVLELIGKGGMGAVYKARQPGLDRLVALKILPREIGCDAAFAERFTREARSLARLNHPNIVAVYDFGHTDDGLFYFLMEYVDGVNLRQAIQSGGMSPKEALAIVPQICDALQFAHDEGIVHRDIKPENVLLDKRGRVKIADFGLAKLLGHASGDVSLTATQQVMGTLRYMAPEQMEGTKAVDHRADIYSLGVVFYELLTGEVPIGRFAPPSKKVQIDVRLDEVVLRALEEKPEQRYQHASEVKTDVETICTGVALSTSTPIPSQSREADLDRLVVELLPRKKMVAIRLYREKTGVGLKEAKDAVEAIARKHGIQEVPITRGQRLLMAVVLGGFVLAAVIATAALPAHLGLSSVVTTAVCWALVIPFLIVPNVRLASRLRGTGEGRRAVWSAAFWGLVLVLPLLSALPEPGSALDWIYRVTGTKPGRNDVMFFQTVFLAAVLATLVWLIVFLVRSRSQRAQASLSRQNQVQAAVAALPSAAAATAAVTAGGCATATTLRTFTAADPTITKDVVLDGGAWLAVCTQAQTYRLFEVSEPGVEDCTVIYRAKLKTEGLTGRAYLEMWCRLSGRGEFFSKGLNQIATGSNDWATYETPFFLKKGEKPDLIRLNLVVEATGKLSKKAVTGKVWIADMELVQHVTG